MYSAYPNLFIALSSIALWTPYRQAWKVGFLLAVLSGFSLGMLDLSALFTIFVYGSLWMAYANRPDQTRFWAIVVFALLLKLRLLGGFYSVALTPGFYFNLSPAVAGLLPLAYVRRGGLEHWRPSMGAVALERTSWIALGKGLGISFLGIGALAFAAISGGLISWHIALPSHALLRYASQLFLVCPLEEGLYRGFMQNEMERYLGSSMQAWLGSSALFALAHYYWAPSVGILLFTLLAGLLYGLVYRVSRSLECAIFCHFLLNFVHMTFFTYHAM